MTTRGRIGSMIRDKYRVDTFVATGSMANVYAATHRNGSRVALKVMHRELASDPQMRERFKREGYFANSIGHRGVVRAIDDDVTDDGCPFLVMELLEGEDVESRRNRLGGRIPLGEVLGIADGVLDVLAAAHAKDVLHRDLKPENVFLTREGEVKLLDFGVARWNDGKDSSDVTGVGMVLGTPAFMPPEQALGRREDVDARSDLWALGATLFTMITGEPVHAGGSAKSKLIATARTPARKLREVAPNVPRAVASVIDRALEFERHDRWDDAKAMREALRWARMSLDHEAEVQTSSVPDLSIAPSVPTRRAPTDDELTVMRDFSKSDEVYTSAPPITLRDVPAASAAVSSDGPTFVLRQRPAPAPVEETAPETERFAPRQTTPGPGPVLDLPPLIDEGPVSSEELPLEYTRPMAKIPPGLAGTLPLAAAPAPAPVPALAPMSRPPPGSLVAQVAPRSSGAARILVPLVLVVMLGGTTAFVMLKKREAEMQAPTAATTAAASIPAVPSAAPPIAASDLPAAPAPPATSAVAASARPTAPATTKARPRPHASAAPTASASATATASATASAAPTAEPAPAPTPTPAPAPTSDESP